MLERKCRLSHVVNGERKKGKLVNLAKSGINSFSKRHESGFIIFYRRRVAMFEFGGARIFKNDFNSGDVDYE